MPSHSHMSNIFVQRHIFKGKRGAVYVPQLGKYFDRQLRQFFCWPRHGRPCLSHQLNGFDTREWMPTIYLLTEKGPHKSLRWCKTFLIRQKNFAELDIRQSSMFFSSSDYKNDRLMSYSWYWTIRRGPEKCKVKSFHHNKFLLIGFWLWDSKSTHHSTLKVFWHEQKHDPQPGCFTQEMS